MNYMVETIMKKHAGFMEWYKRTQASPGFKAKKLMGKGILAATAIGAPLAYGAHKLTSEPEPQSKPPQPHQY